MKRSAIPLVLYVCSLSIVCLANRSAASDIDLPECSASGAAELNSERCLESILDAWVRDRVGDRESDFGYSSLDDFRDRFGASKPTPSYALGARFFHDVADELDEFDYRMFLLGIVEQADENRIRFAEESIDAVLEDVLLDEAERSARYLSQVVDLAGVRSWKGVHYFDRGVELSAASDRANACQPPTEGSPRDYHLAFTRLELDRTLPDEPSWECLSVDEGEVIRGWRSVLREMKTGDVWEVVIPPESAYGDVGARTVAPGEALRFLIKLIDRS